jgi:hypothetical protein
VLIRRIVDDHWRSETGSLLRWRFCTGRDGAGQRSHLFGYLAAAVAQAVLSNLRVRLFDHSHLPASPDGHTPLAMRSAAARRISTP